jgi:hypothetical protein
VTARSAIEAELQTVRTALVEAIGKTLPAFARRERSLLLAVKRSCFKGREIARYRESPEWPAVLRVDAGSVERILALETRLGDLERALGSLYDRELERQRRHVLELVRDRRFLRGIALGREGLVEKARTSPPPRTAAGDLPRAAKWEASLLRFATRAAAKLSANSTLTTYALGNLGGSALRFVAAPGREVSLVRVNRPESERLQMLLMLHPAVRERGLVVRNESLEEVAPGRYRFLRGGHWSLDPGAERFELVPPARVTADLPADLLTAVVGALGKEGLIYGVLLERLEAVVGSIGGGGIRAQLDRLLDLGAIVLLPPWPHTEPALERRILESLRDWDEPSLRPTVRALEAMSALEEEFSRSSRPERSVAGMRSAYSTTVRATAEAAGRTAPPEPGAHFFEDVLLESTAGNGALLDLPAATAEEILRNAGRILRFSALFSHRLDVLHTLAAWWWERYAARRSMPFLEVAQGFAPLWRRFLAFDKTANESALTTFNPLDSPEIQRLRELREAFLHRYLDLLDRLPDKEHLPAAEFERLLSTLPRRYAPLLDGCVFVQPADGEGRTWVLNSLHEGTGRYLSRVTPVLPPPIRERFVRHLESCSKLELGGEPVDLLEVMHPWHYLMNAHAPQAARLLAIPGLRHDLPRERSVALGELTLRADPAAGRFDLVDASGCRLLPVHLSSMRDAALSSLLRFLLVFGPGETRGVFPMARREESAGRTYDGRLSVGNLVVRRRRWTVWTEGLRSALKGLSDSQAYVEIHRWRAGLGLPREGFYYERTYHGAFKPQYVDFSSPALCRLFVASLDRRKSSSMTLEEALPSPSAYPRDSSGDRRACELVIDSLAIDAAAGASSAAAFTTRWEQRSQKGRTPWRSVKSPTLRSRPSRTTISSRSAGACPRSPSRTAAPAPATAAPPTPVRTPVAAPAARTFRTEEEPRPSRPREHPPAGRGTADP